MVSTVLTSFTQSSLHRLSVFPKLFSSSKSLVIQTRFLLPNRVYPFSSYGSWRLTPIPKRKPLHVCFFNTGNESKPNLQQQESGLECPVLKRWDVPWQWQTVSLTTLACGLSFFLRGLIEKAALFSLGLKIEEISLDQNAELLFLSQSITTAVILGVLYGVTKSFQPLPEDVFRYDFREPFDLQKGWLLWAGIGLSGGLLAVALTGVAIYVFSGETPRRETDVLLRLTPLIGSSTFSTACLIGVTGVLAPILEESVFRGFLLVSLTKWVPTPVASIISAAIFALAHRSPGEFPQLFVFGTILGISYAQTRNLLTPITMHAFWNSGLILILILLQLQGYDIKDFLRVLSS